MPRYRNDSEFGDGPRVPKNRLERQVWLASVGQRRRVGEISPSGYNICRILLDFLGSDGRLDLAHETIAQLAGCSIATVKRQLRVLRRLGFVSWTRRLIRGAISTEQISNAYVLKLPEALNRTALEQNEREESSYLKPSSCTPISLKAVRAKHQNAEKHKQNFARSAFLELSQPNQDNDTKLAKYISDTNDELEKKRALQSPVSNKKHNRFYLDKKSLAIEDDISAKRAQVQLAMLAELGLENLSSERQLATSAQPIGVSSTYDVRPSTFRKSSTSIEMPTAEARTSRAYQRPGDRSQSQLLGLLSRSSHATISEEQNQDG